jgi:hypothetical protein
MRHAHKTHKTRDVWCLYLDYGHGQGWELETTEDSHRAVKEQSECYRENCPQYPRKITFKREPQTLQWLHMLDVPTWGES